MKYQVDTADSVRNGMRLFNALFFEKGAKGLLFLIIMDLM